MLTGTPAAGKNGESLSQLDAHLLNQLKTQTSWTDITHPKVCLLFSSLWIPIS